MKRLSPFLVTIYEDPITQQKPEGKARLVRLVERHDADKSERWEVKFEGDDQTVERVLYPRATRLQGE